MGLLELLPFYVVCDVSASMREDGRSDAVTAAVVATCDAIATNPVVADRTRFGVVAFAADAEVVLPLCDVSFLDALPVLRPRGLTNYGPAFVALRATIEQDVAQLAADGCRVFRPAVFFLTDGRPSDPPAAWRSALGRLRDPGFGHRPNIVAFGFGQCDPAVLREVATVASYVASDVVSTAAAIGSFGTLLVESVVASGTSGRFRLPETTPDGLDLVDRLDLV